MGRSQKKIDDDLRMKQLTVGLLRLYNCKCAICGWQLCKDGTPLSDGNILWKNGLEVHHIIPRSEDGPTTENNLIPLCPSHHKQADMGLISRDELYKYQKYGGDYRITLASFDAAKPYFKKEFDEIAENKGKGKVIPYFLQRMIFECEYRKIYIPVFEENDDTESKG